MVPVIDVSPLYRPAPVGPDSASSGAHGAHHRSTTIAQIDAALSTWGFMIITGAPGPSPAATSAVVAALERFFALPLDEKRKLDLRDQGWRWRGYMPAGGEGTKTQVDHKEGFYGGGEHPASHTLINLPTHGSNVFPTETQVPGMKAVTSAYIDQVTELVKTLCDAIGEALGLEDGWMRNNVLGGEGPVQLFRAFHYRGTEDNQDGFGIGEHTDFGLLTILSPHGPGLQIRHPDTEEWVHVPLVENSFVVNVGDILDRLTHGRYRSRPHRVLPPLPGQSRISIHFFFDPSWSTEIKAFPIAQRLIPDEEQKKEVEERWSKTTFTRLDGIWGQYLAVKVRKVFPDIASLNLPEFSAVSRESMRHRLPVSKEVKA
ncbi:2OG-Fe(II) oxygenase [Pseudohyphozyma bogoriensis]|nr:2OG-Fe(II) oxygenase [Pseudohyphozyma bogoriensis]